MRLRKYGLETTWLPGRLSVPTWVRLTIVSESSLHFGWYTARSLKIDWVYMLVKSKLMLVWKDSPSVRLLRSKFTRLLKVYFLLMVSEVPPS